ncbi:hypothetical protein swp_4891 [Shewanella piezotolerans WP3]|uniref:Uncharacterized protein n=1 Tax=Shewanella piezotolerans (strain WP3 / JCM 13877) TaxID=225849 RepID=B8CV36_SHEPW|nr:hypothetical protein swp_4891 [Shewanella piezotolerans WP3]
MVSAITEVDANANSAIDSDLKACFMGRVSKLIHGWF